MQKEPGKKNGLVLENEYLKAVNNIN